MAASPAPFPRLRFAIDRGGTFCDVFCEIETGPGAFTRRVLKLLSEDPDNYPDAPREGIRRVLQEALGRPLPPTEPVPTANITSIRMGTTVATNALLERKGEPTALVVTAGFRDLLHIGTQARPRIFDLAIRAPDTLYQRVIEASERVVPAPGPGSAPETGETVRGDNGEEFVIRKPLDEVALRAELEAARSAGLKSVAVVLLHAYAVPRHEVEVGRLCRELGFEQVSLSHQVMPMVKAVARGNTACADAYLTPHIDRYLRSFASGFADELRGVEVLFMQSDGGMTDGRGFSGHRAILSGPAGGVVGFARTTTRPEEDDVDEDEVEAGSAEPLSEEALLALPPHPVVGLDMGGTSTDVSRFDGVAMEHVYETTTAGVTVQAPQLDIHTVAAGGGSRLFVRAGMLSVGPESAGAHPGPVCYRKGGHLAVTDANAVLGRLLPEFFPSIFGPREDQPLDVDGARRAMQRLADTLPPAPAAAASAATSAAAANAAAAGAADADATVAADAAASSGPKPGSATSTRSAEDVALGFIRVANEAMCRPIRALTQMRGFDASKHTLACFGGAAGQHACAIARTLGMRRVFMQRFSGILSAVGIGLANIVEEAQEPFSAKLALPNTTSAAAEPGADGASAELSACDDVAAAVAERARSLAAAAGSKLTSRGYAASGIKVTVFANVRYEGTDTALMVPCGDGAGWLLSDAVDGPLGALSAAVSAAPATFVAQYFREYGFTLSGRALLVEDVRVRVVSASGAGHRDIMERTSEPLPAPLVVASVVFAQGRLATPVFKLASLRRGQRVDGPALLVDETATVLVEPGFRARLSAHGDVVMKDLWAEPSAARILPPAGAVSAPPAAPAAPPAPAAPAAPAAAPASGFTCDPVQLSLFGHRFMGIAEQMGRTLQRTSISVNIKERLDFSCALFAPDGGLVANAPHLPVHLGAMSEAVRCQLRHWGDDIRDGDVLMSNHPQLAGGSHLPDITVITPVFAEPGASGSAAVCFFVASRGHHADIGGIAPGSMPPMSKRLAEEGAAIVAFKLVRDGRFREEEVSELLLAPGKSGVPGCSGSRNLPDSLSDLRAQVAANQRGISLVRELIAEYSLPRVHAYMRFIRETAAEAVRGLLMRFADRRGWRSSAGLALSDGSAGEVGHRKMAVEASDRMDDGTPIKLRITVDEATRSAEFNFAGTGPEVYGNTNAPPAVSHSAVIYVLRALIDDDVPLNQGCLEPVTIAIPPGSLLHPSVGAAVVGGNVLTSQRVVDVVLKAFGETAASQGCMNNLTFGDATLGYYETICGGAGAGRGFDGRSGTQVHMTNTRATDVEVLERRYPVVLRRFSLRDGSGGAGRWRGGCGAVRWLEFRRPLTVSILSERRTLAPFGLEGGGPGQRGINLLHRTDGRIVSLGGKSTVQVEAGESLEIRTPGGGGFGAPDAAEADEDGTVFGPVPVPAPGGLAASQQAEHVPRREGGGSLGKFASDQLSA
ncbi:hypothetical protein FNF28_06053 [Cafeteria roenbergensis]|uniref:5-oxoprolinase n=1 Tax=Cafeteria roenbergensis TaxID=33653 RepID=A0A5A8D0G9_CAFRO|nr:hypothetical protein FNF28_06053 [Cafeteria roenbergensis]